MSMILWVEGLIGAGKSTLTAELQHKLGCRLLSEPVDNTHLARFYSDPAKYAFGFQMGMLIKRSRLHRLAAAEALSGEGRGVILDRGLPGDRVFALMHRRAGNIESLDWATYEAAYNDALYALQPPSMVLYLDVTPKTALERVQRRSRMPEKVGVTLEYLTKLRDSYEELFDELTGGPRHPWARLQRIVRVDWNDGHRPVDRLVEELREFLAVTAKAA